MNNYYRYSPIMGYLYVNACIAYATQIRIPNPKIKRQWIRKWIQKELDWFHNQEPSIQEALESYEARLNKGL